MQTQIFLLMNDDENNTNEDGDSETRKIQVEQWASHLLALSFWSSYLVSLRHYSSVSNRELRISISLGYSED